MSKLALHSAIILRMREFKQWIVYCSLFKVFIATIIFEKILILINIQSTFYQFEEINVINKFYRKVSSQNTYSQCPVAYKLEDYGTLTYNFICYRRIHHPMKNQLLLYNYIHFASYMFLYTCLLQFNTSLIVK